MRPTKIFRSGLTCLLLQWDTPSLTLARNSILEYSTFINEQCRAAVVDVVPTYTELAIYVAQPESMLDVIKAIQSIDELKPKNVRTSTEREITVPVCYGDEFGLDIEHVATVHHCTVNEVITKHTKARYQVAFIGFLPGFPYVTGLPKDLATPRRREPRPNIAAGSVGIGGSQTGVYPQDSPGGWNIIGRTPVSLFNPNVDPPSVFQAGDVLRFESITKKEYKQIVKDIANGAFTLKKTFYD